MGKGLSLVFSAEHMADCLQKAAEVSKLRMSRHEEQKDILRAALNPLKEASMPRRSSGVRDKCRSRSAWRTWPQQCRALCEKALQEENSPSTDAEEWDPVVQVPWETSMEEEILKGQVRQDTESMKLFILIKCNFIFYFGNPWKWQAIILWCELVSFI